MRGTYKEAIDVYTAVLRDLEGGMQRPAEVELGEGHVVLQFQAMDPQHAMIMKLAAAVSGLNACVALLDIGHIFETGILKRVIEDAAEDAIFLALAVIRGEWTTHHQKFLEDFWAEPFNDARDVAGTIRRSDGAKRDKIRNYVNSGTDDPHNAGRASTSIFVMYSGFVHTHSRSLMEIYDHRTRQFSVSGSTFPEQVNDHGGALWNYVYRVGLAFRAVAKALGLQEHDAVIHEQLVRFQDATGRDGGTSRQ